MNRDTNNFYATEGVERASSVDSVFSDIVPTDFVKAVAQLGPDHLVEAMYEAVNHMKVGNIAEVSSNFSPPTSSSSSPLSRQQKLQEVPLQQSPAQQQHMIFQHQHQNQKAIVLNQQQQILLYNTMMTILQNQQVSPQQLAVVAEAHQRQAQQQQNIHLSQAARLSNSSATDGDGDAYCGGGGGIIARPVVFVANDSAPHDHRLDDSRSASSGSVVSTGTSSTKAPPPPPPTKNTQQQQQLQAQSQRQKTKINQFLSSLGQAGGAELENRNFTSHTEAALLFPSSNAYQLSHRYPLVENLTSDDDNIASFDKAIPATTTAICNSVSHFTPVVTRLKHSPSRRRAAQKPEDLRNSAIVEGEDPAVIAIPPKSPKGSNFPSTPSYWDNNNNRSGSSPTPGNVYGKSASVRSPPNTPSWVQSRRAGITTPPVPRPDLQEETELADKALLERRRREHSGITLSEIEAEQAQKRQKENDQKQWNVDLRRRVAALSEHYRRQFGNSNNSSTTSTTNSRDEVREEDNNEADDYGARRPHKKAFTPSETVFRSRAVRMAAAEHQIISAPAQLHAELDGKPRIRSPYGSLLSVSELDHFVPSVPPLRTAALLSSPHYSREHPPRSKSGEAIERTLREGSLEMAARAMDSVDRWSSSNSNIGNNNKGGGNQKTPNVFMGPEDYGYRRSGEGSESLMKSKIETSDQVARGSGHGSRGAGVAVELEPSRPTADDIILSSPQLSAMLVRLMKQREELDSSSSEPGYFGGGGGGANDDKRSKSGTLLLNDDGTTVTGSRRSLFDH